MLALFRLHKSYTKHKKMNRLEKCAYIKKPDVWVPHDLVRKNLMDPIFICELLLHHNNINTFLKQMVTMVMKSGSLTAAFEERGRGSRAVNQSKWFLSQDWLPERICCLFLGVGKESSTELLMRTCNVSYWTIDEHSFCQNREIMFH